MLLTCLCSSFKSVEATPIDFDCVAILIGDKNDTKTLKTFEGQVLLQFSKLDKRLLERDFVLSVNWNPGYFEDNVKAVTSQMRFFYPYLY